MGIDLTSRNRYFQWHVHVSILIYPILSHKLIFDSHHDPFYIKEEFAPSDRTVLAKKQQAVHNMLAPHMRLLQLLSSHFNATRLGSSHTEKTFLRILNLTLDSLKRSTGHPLAREIRFQIVLFGLRVLRHTTTLDFPSKCRLKDKILSAALSWFTFAPRWSFGGNRLQLKAETRLLNDVVLAFKSVTLAGPKPLAMLQLMQAKEELLHILIESEQTRLNVWLDPLRQGRDIQVPVSVKAPTDAALLPLVRTAWNENPSLAIQLVSRFPSARLHHDIRLLLLQFPDKAISEPEAVHILLGDTLPPDVAFQMKVRGLRALFINQLTNLVPSILGSCQPDIRCYIFPTVIPKPSLYRSICYASFGKSLCRCHLLLRATDSTDATL